MGGVYPESQTREAIPSRRYLLSLGIDVVYIWLGFLTGFTWSGVSCVVRRRGSAGGRASKGYKRRASRASALCTSSERFEGAVSRLKSPSTKHSYAQDCRGHSLQKPAV